MASIYRRGRSPYYYCRIADGDHYVRRSTKERTEAAAQRVADRWEAESWLKKKTPAAVDNLREEFLAWALKRGIPETLVLDWLDARGNSEILSSLKRLEASVAELQRLLIARQATEEPYADPI